MSKIITRRDILKFTGGGILGVMLSPLPWKLLDDSAIWTQNWSLTPQLPRGPITTAFSHCTLCNGGCAIKAQCVSGMPYFVSGVQNHPATHGTICPRGLASHHMAHHPLRIVHPHTFVGKSGESRMVALSLNEALDEIAKQMSEAKGSIAILDQQPGRAISELYEEFLSKIKNGVYLSSPSNENATIVALQEMMDRKSESSGYDFENTKLILSFGAPLLDGWGTPGRMTAIKNRKSAKFIQIDSRYSRTAMQADQWIALKPGTERILALSIAYVLINENLVTKQIQSSAIDFGQFKNIVKNFNPEKTVTVTDIQSHEVRKIAEELVTSESAIVLSGADSGGGPFDTETEKAIASLNLLIGNIGKQGGIVARKEIPGYASPTQPMQWSNIPDHSISVLIVDDADSGYALPWSLIEKKLTTEKSFVVSLSPVLNEISAHSDLLVPAPAHFESLRDVPNTTGSATATFALSTPLLKKQDGTTEPTEMLKEVAQRLNISLEIPAFKEILMQKVRAIHSQKRGTVFSYTDQSSTNVSDISSSDDLWIKLTEGAIWIDGTSKQFHPVKLTFALSTNSIRQNVDQGLQLIAYGWKGATSFAQVSPIMSKVFQESELRDVNGTVTINPKTAHQFGLSKDELATLSTKNGSLEVRARISTSVRPGIIEASIGPLPNGIETPAHPAGTNILNLCEVTGDGTWRVTTANLLKV
ncbi:MAG: molybdopterin-dependent oxidoreductase [Ignavibacteriales bacterium]|nr:molybdopterin-dependent oxidoreductase [Ignavibacteriales bacterium]